MALEKGKKYGNFIIPNLRQNLCNGKFKLHKSSNSSLVVDNTENTKKRPKINEEVKMIIKFFNIKPLKTKTFKIGKFDYNSLEKIKVSKISLNIEFRQKKVVNPTRVLIISGRII